MNVSLKVLLSLFRALCNFKPRWYFVRAVAVIPEYNPKYGVMLCFEIWGEIVYALGF